MSAPDWDERSEAFYEALERQYDEDLDFEHFVEYYAIEIDTPDQEVAY